MENTEEQNLFMSRCLQLASHGLGYVAPNPMVGSVIVHEGKIIGEGYHQEFGSSHAEVNAINSVMDKSLLAKSILYVNLEPCSHQGKTPPCSSLIIDYKIPKVVIGMIDPFAKVNGNGIKQLDDAGIDVIVGIHEEECKQLNKRFITHQQKKRPYLILKWAQSADGFIGDENKEVIISNALSKIYSHKWRSEEAAILIGSTTAKVDNPQLNVRENEGPNPTRILIDNNGNLPANLHLFDGSQATFVVSYNSAVIYPNTKIILVNQESFIEDALKKLAHEGIQSIIIEGGRKTLQSFIDANYWDEARVFQSENLLEKGVSAPIHKGILTSSEKLNDNILNLYRNPNSL